MNDRTHTANWNARNPASRWIQRNSSNWSLRKSSTRADADQADEVDVLQSQMIEKRDGIARVQRVGDQAEGPHEDNLRDVGRRYADVMSLSAVITALQGG